MGALVFALEPGIHRASDLRLETRLPAKFGIVDLFAGPGGLGEGFASLVENGHSPFQIGISVEKEKSAHRTLSLRAFLRAYQERYDKLPDQYIDFHAGDISEPDWSEIDAGAWNIATAEARALELGTEAAATAIDNAIGALKTKYDETVLIGGPPCQAYSLVGRARSKGKTGYVPEDDERHYLFREYIRVLDKLRPAVFVMENVKGMLSSTVESRLVFEMLMEDLSSIGNGGKHHYALRAIQVEDGRAFMRVAEKPSEFVVRAEDFGIPQKRHRVIIIGIRSDLASKTSFANTVVTKSTRTVSGTISTLPKLRSGISRGGDSLSAWRDKVAEAADTLVRATQGTPDRKLHKELFALQSRLDYEMPSLRRSSALPEQYGASNDELMRWIERVGVRAVAQHETRGHMISDLGRYFFASVFGSVHGTSPKPGNFPEIIHPNHKNWDTGIFDDRFRVQLANQPSTTVTSHISKDGHYFIHPDPMQCRSLTVREAARLQTFPDDYIFIGNRTQQYVQVGNAVPPFLARQIALLIHRVLAPQAADKNEAGESSPAFG